MRGEPSKQADYLFMIVRHLGSTTWNISIAINRWEFGRSMRHRTNACVPRDVSRDKRGKFCKHLKASKPK